MSGFSFGSQTRTNQMQKSTPFVFSFGNTSTPSTTPSLFTPTCGNTLSGTSLFGSTLTPATSTASLFSGVSTTPTITLSSPLTSTTTSGGFPGLLSGSSLTSTGFGFGFNPTPTSTPGFGLGSTAVTTTTSSVGLGGVDFTQTSAGLTGGTSSLKSDSKAVKETLLPNEIGSTIESFKKYVKDQKVIREEISRVSEKPVLKVQEETAALKQLLSVVSNGLQRNALAIQKLKHESAQELKNAEIAQRTKDTPPSLQYENTAPCQYFQQLEASFEHQMQSYRKQIEQLEQHLTFVSQPSVLTPQDLTMIMKRLHGTFVALAAQLQTIHQLVQTQKEQFLAVHWAFQGSTNNIFGARRSNNSKGSLENSIPVTVGPAPFSHMPSPAAVAMASALNRTQQPSGGSSLTAVPGQSSITGGFGTGGLGGGLGTGSSFVGQSNTIAGCFPSFKPIGK